MDKSYRRGFRFSVITIWFSQLFLLIGLGIHWLFWTIDSVLPGFIPRYLLDQFSPSVWIACPIAFVVACYTSRNMTEWLLDVFSGINHMRDKGRKVSEYNHGNTSKSVDEKGDEKD